MTTGMTVLAVDDEPDILSAMQGYLEGELGGLRVRTANTGAEGLDVLRGERVDLIITDYRMPEMDGLRFLEEAGRVAPTVPKMIVTAYPDMELAIKALNEHRIVHFLTKPVDPEMLREVVAAILDKSLSARQREAAFKRSLEVMQRRAAAPSA